MQIRVKEDQILLEILLVLLSNLDQIHLLLKIILTKKMFLGNQYLSKKISNLLLEEVGELLKLS